MATHHPALFQPIQLGGKNITLKHRIVLAPLTRYRANKKHVHGDLGVEYYRQRGSTPGTLLITEATFIAAEAAGYDNAPGVWTEEQVAGWKRITEAVHSKQSYIFLQLWALGRAATLESLKSEDPSYEVVSASDIPLADHAVPKPLSKDDIARYVQHYANAAKNAIRAGFDGVEIHGANGYLIDQFIQSVSNKRTDEFGGSIENRLRFPLQVVKAVTEAVGQERTAIRLSPWSTFQDMREPDPIPVFSKLVTELKTKFPKMAYLHLVEPQVAGNHSTTDPTTQPESNDFIREIWTHGPPLIVAGNLSPESADKIVREKGGLTAFGRWFISNPDLPVRIARGRPLTPFDYKTFYLRESANGYTDYPFDDDSSTGTGVNPESHRSGAVDEVPVQKEPSKLSLSFWGYIKSSFLWVWSTKIFVGWWSWRTNKAVDGTSVSKITT